MISITQLRAGTFFEEDGQVFEVLTYGHTKMGRGSGNIRLKVRNLETGAIIDKTFITGASVAEANLLKIKAQFLYQDGENFHFMDSQTFEQFAISGQKLAKQKKFFKEGLELYLLVYKGKPLAIELPRALSFKVAQTGPSYKGNSVTNIFKPAILENGLEIKIPVFIKVGEIVKIDTKTGEYLEREKIVMS
jgi:elongation factor P